MGGVIAGKYVFIKQTDNSVLRGSDDDISYLRYFNSWILSIVYSEHKAMTKVQKHD
jgi:hypothetical protein